MTAKKTLVAYLSASGETARLARTLADVTGGDLHEIVPAEALHGRRPGLERPHEPQQPGDERPRLAPGRREPR